jgi:hypothetical protein
MTAMTMTMETKATAATFGGKGDPAVTPIWRHYDANNALLGIFALAYFGNYNATIKRLAIEAHRWLEEALLDKVVGRDDNGGRGGQDKGLASVITNAQRRLLLMFHRCYPTRIPPVCSLFKQPAVINIGSP